MPIVDKRRGAKTIVTLGMFSFLTSLSGSSTNLALPQIAIDLHIQSSEATWVVQIGLITTTILLVMFGHLGDIMSKDLIFITGGVLFTVGSAVTGLAPYFAVVLIGRAIQAIGSAMIMANAMGIVSENFSDKGRAEVLSIVAMFISFGSISGPAVGGLVLSITSWRWIYLFNVPLGIVVIIVGMRVLTFPKLTRQLVKSAVAGANWTGQNLFTLGIILFFLSGSVFQNGLKNWIVGAALLVVGLGLIIAAFWQDDLAPKPWIAPQLLRNPAFVLSITILGLAMLVNAVSNILLPFYLQSYGGMSPFNAGLIMMLQSAIMMFVTPLSGYLADHWNRVGLTIIGLAVLLVSQIGYAFYPSHLEFGAVIWPILVNGVGMGLFLSPNNAITMSVVDPSLTGVAGSINSFARTIGMTVGISFGSALLFAQLPNVTRISPATGESFMRAMAVVFWIAVAISVLSLAIVVWRGIKISKQRQ